MMFIVENQVLDVLNSVTNRDLGYGRHDLGGREKVFFWEVPLIDFIAICEDEINGFIEQCKIDDPTLPEPDIDYLYNLNYPSVRELSCQHTSKFCDLLVQFPSVIYDSLHKKRQLPQIQIKTGYAINRLDQVQVVGDMIVLSGVGYYF